MTAVSAVDKRIKSSSHGTNKTSYGGIYAYGYTESDTAHYTTVKLFCSDGQERVSDRAYGTGVVSASTSHMKYDSGERYGSAVYYDFD
ncbi:hypothetical protein EXM36_12410 [Clostridium botulinum]|uniref:hypothetical protein n=1 Tax=Clostridium botulinum TaxID=1491 RepID=UPI001115D431|nr:hypothetical protein [Clostridium botulinum]MCC5418146.1 hypothetical protein [Clostridium botulinum]NCI22263.1 hypothetical protein [Clostridium botulinum]NCI37205.1 hypothetical protein [Clostridium botulinum]NCI74081.1 hypothetical protein [Clostridium botulinum]NDI40545.1 hypothetical protein [Clostridium botulinum]